MKKNETITFYYEWLPIEKKNFRFLAMLADLGEFSGTLSDICRYFGITTGKKNIDKIRDSLLELEESGLIAASCRGRKWELTAIPQATEIQVERELYERILAHDYSSKSVAWQMVVKVLIWLSNSRGKFHKDKWIADELGCSSDLIGDAKAVLLYEFNAINVKVRRADFGWGFWARIGQNVDVKAWRDEE